MTKGMHFMKRTVIFTVVISAAMVAWQFAFAQDGAAESAATQPTTQATPEQYRAAAYSIGYNLGQNLKDAKVPVDANVISEGLRDGFSGAEAKIPQKDVEAAMRAIQQEMAVRQTAEMKDAGSKAKSAGDAYRAENGKKPGVTTTESGLQIEITKEGTGATPTATDKVKVHYTGTLIDGTKFDSSLDRGQPAQFPLNQVIRGWTEGFQKLKVGSKARLVIPPTIGYGEDGYPPAIPPNATLIFDVELLEIVK
jgi:FKBP-type peptidyl-prolyl cis-trans isomerase